MPRLFADCIVIMELEMFEEEIVRLSSRLQTPWSVEWSGAAPMQCRASAKWSAGGLLFKTWLPGRTSKWPPIQTTNTGGGGGTLLWGQKGS